MKTCQDVIQACLGAHPDLAVLILAGQFPPAFERHPGPITFFGHQSPRQGFASRDFLFRAAPTQAELLPALQRLRQTPRAAGSAPAFGPPVFDPPVFDIIFIDHDHRFTALIDQIDHAVALSHATTVFLFDDAVPPEIGMTGPAPTQGWWVGEVWMLAKVLQGDAGFRKWVIDLPPTGMLAATGIRAVPRADAVEHHARLSQIATIEALRAVLTPLEDASGSGLLATALDQCGARDFITIAPSSSSLGADRSVTIDEAEPWIRPELAFLLDLSQRDLDVSRLLHRDRRKHGTCLDVFSDVTLTGFDSFVKDNTFYARSIVHAGSVARRLIDDRAYSRTILQLRDDSIVLPKSALAEAIPLEGSVFLGTPDEPDNWGMWLLYGVPSAARFLRDRASHDGYLTYLGQPWQRRLLNHLGIADTDLIEHHLARPYHLARLTLIRHEFRDLTVGRHDRAAFLDVSERFARDAAGRYGEKIFISRRDHARRSGGYRALVNEDALCAALTQRGFAVIEPDQLDFPEQVRAFAGARVIVGLGGAGLFNVVFARPGTRVVTIESSLTWVDAHVNLIASCDLECGVILGQQDLSDPTPDHKRWSLDVEAAVQRIDRFLD